MFKVCCFRPKSDFEEVNFRIPETVEVVFCTDYREEAMISACNNVDAILAPSPYPRIPRKVIEAGKNLKLIQLTGAGFDTVDLEAAKETGVKVANVSGGNARAVAEYTLLVAGVLGRRLITSFSMTNKGYEETRSEVLSNSQWEFARRTFGIIGMGRIGKEVARMANFFGIKILYYDLQRSSENIEAELGAKYVSLHDLLEAADVVTIHVPLNDQTRDLISYEELKRMKSSAHIINADRGGIINESALIWALENEEIAGAAIDSFVTEPLPGEHPLAKFSIATREKLLLTPHIAGGTVQSFQRMFDASWNNILRVARGEMPENLVSK